VGNWHGLSAGESLARQSDKYQAFVAEQPAVKVFLEQAKYGRSRPIFPSYNRLSESLGRAIEAVLLGKSSPESALKAAQQRLDLIFGKLTDLQIRHSQARWRSTTAQHRWLLRQLLVIQDNMRVHFC